MKAIDNWEKKGQTISSIKPWLFTLEVLGDVKKYNYTQIRDMIQDNGLISGSYSAIAYALINGIESPKSLEHIGKIVEENDGGVIELDKSPYFEVSWAIGYLVFADFDICNEKLVKNLDMLERKWRVGKGIIGCSDQVSPDSDNAAMTLLVLSKAGRLTARECVDGLLKYRRGDHFVSMEAEVHPSLSANINALLALKNFQRFDDINEISKNVAVWAKNWINLNNFEDKWHSSQYYPMSRALIAFEFYDPEFAQKIFNLILDGQNEDGGWGMNGKSSRLETSYSLISLIYWMKSRRNSIEVKSVLSLAKAEQFFENSSDENGYNFWIGKQLYSPINIDKMTVLCAEYSLNKFWPLLGVLGLAHLRSNPSH